MKGESTYRMILPPISVASRSPKVALDSARDIARRMNEALEQMGLSDLANARVERRGPRGGWNRTTNPPAKSAGV